MIWKIVVVMFALFVVLLLVGLVYQNVPSEPVKMKVGEVGSESFSMVSYDGNPVYWDNLRFNHNNISYFINDSCPEGRRESMIEAFGIFERMTDYIYFYGVDGDADIDVECSNKSMMLSDNLVAAGEGGQVGIINTSLFKIIERGKIFLYDDPKCNYPVVELHELGHVFGFDHSDDPLSVMFPYARCEQRMTDDMVRFIDGLYFVEALADVRISDLTAIKRGRYLDFNLTILNEGLSDAFGVNLSVIADGEVVRVFGVGDIEFGFGRTLYVENLKMPSRDFDAVDFYIDKENIVRELDEGNNVAGVTA
ncbi:MAG: matrixin family metalloprotease [archaeon]